MSDFARSLLAFILLTLTGLASAQDQVAKPGEHPYADPKAGRDGYRHAGEKVNEARLYDFYPRQADYYRGMDPEARPKILPAHPGLDAGKHGHWGKHNQNNHEDGRWNQIDIGGLHTQVTRGPGGTVLKGINVKLGEDISACFDPLTLSYRCVWKGWIQFQPFRWGTSRNAEIKGDTLHKDDKPAMPKGGKYLGFYRHGERVIFHYEIDGTEVLDSPGAKDGKFVRTVQFVGGKKVELSGPAAVEGKLEALTKGGPALWASKTVTTSTGQGEAPQGKAYAVDDLAVPYENPFQSVMQLSGIAFDKTGTAFLSTLCGELWSVTGLGAAEGKLVWRRVASGFNQPMGVHLDEDGIFLLDRGQIYRLHDRNGDGEFDFYENYANDFGGYDRSHSHTFGLHRTEDGAFHFTQRESVLRTSAERSTEEVGWGVRNCMGIGGSADFFWVGPQEGTWTPATSIIEVKKGEFYGLPKGNQPNPIAPPLCFIPRGIDNSVGGFVEVTSDKWGPFQGAHIGLSYGASLHYLVFRDAAGARPQGAVAPLDGEFLAGAVRGAFHPVDGQLYLVGLDGWGDYSIKDGCFHRVRYTGSKVRRPSGFAVHENGIRIDFTTALDAGTAEDLKNTFAQSWNYEYAKRYGSPEFSPSAGTLGHDVVAVRSVKLLEGGRSLFVEMPDLEPVMQLYLRMKLQDSEGNPFDADLYASPMYPAAHFDFPGAAAPVEGKAKAVTLRIDQPKAAVAKNATGKPLKGARKLVVDATGGLQFKQTLLEVKPKEALSLQLKNEDVVPHNLIIVSPGALKKVGEASFKMLNDPKAAEKSYAPDMKEVLHIMPIVEQNKDHVLHFRAPAEPGDYPYLCTYPGHWQVMQGILRVKE